MSTEELTFKVEQKDKITIFTNDTQMYVEVSLIPIPPKRKYIDIMVITPGKCVVHDGYQVDLSKLCFRFKTRKEVLDERS